MPKLDELLQGVALAVATEDPIVARATSVILRRRGAAALEIISPSIVAARTDHGARFDVVLLDLRAESDSALIANAEARRRSQGVPIVLMISETQWQTIRTGRDVDPNAFAIIPPDEAELTAAILVNLERRKLERRLVETERRFEATLESIGEGVVATDPRGSVTFMNARAEMLVGRTLAEARCRPIEEVMPLVTTGGRDQVANPVRSTLESRTVVETSGASTLVASNGERRPVDVTAAPIVLRHDHEALIGAVVAFRDVGERLRMESALRENEARYRSVVEDQTEFIVRWLPDGTRLFVNDAYARYFGQSRQEMIGTSFLPLIQSEAERDGVLAKIKSLRPDAAAMSSLHRARRADGVWRWQEWIDRGVFDARGVLVELQSVGRDVHERVVAEQELRGNRRLLQILVEDSPAAVAMFDTEMRYLFWSKRWISDYRLADIDLRGKSHYEVFPEIDENWKAVHRRCLAGATESREDDPFLRADGRTDYIRWVVKPWHKAGREVGGLILLTEVVTDRKLTEQTLRKSERQFRAIFDQTFQFIGLLSTDGTLIEANRTALEFAGISEAEVHGRPFWETPWWSHSPELQERLKEAVREAAAGRFVRLEVTHPGIDGRVHTVDFSLKPVHDETGRVTLLIPEGRDITERKIAEDALAASEERYRSMLDCLPFGILVHDGKTLLYANPGALRLLDVAALDEVSSSLPAELLNADSPEAARERLGAIIRTGDSPPPIEALVKRRDGVAVDVEVHVTRSRFAGRDCVQLLVQDITARNRLETQLRQSQKMQAIGQLAGGVAHDFNNLLTVINGCSDLLGPRLKNASGDVTDALAAIRDAGERATLLTRQLLAFSRKQVLEPRVLDLNEVVADSERMLRRLIGEDITLATIRDPALAPVRVDRGQIEQVVLNLCLNARDAMPRGGRLTIETANVDLDEATCRNQPDARPGRYVRLTITDTGCGMTEEIKCRVFEPFFTTKEKGRGTGLGLSTVYGIVRQSEGQIAVYSEVDLGTTFKILLPAVANAVPTPTVIEVEAAPRQGTETILLVEDETAVRRVARMALAMHGYTVLEAASGPEAIALVANHEAPIHLVVTDLVMPDMSGRELAEALRARHPEILVLFVSGYTEDTVVLHGILEARDHFLSKPFTPIGLARKVRQILDTDVGTVPGTFPTLS